MRFCSSLSWWSRKWSSYIAWSARMTIFIFIMMILQAGFYVDRSNGNIERKVLELDVNDNLETMQTKKDISSVEKIIKYAVNVPNEVLENESKEFEYERKCTQLPKVSNIILVNDFWQKVSSFDGFPLYLYSAHYDKREIFNGDAFIRVFAMLNKQQTNEDYLCNIWFQKNGRIDSVSTLVRFLEVKPLKVPLKYNTYMLNCEIPKSHINEVPFAVSITKSDCEKVSNILHVNNQTVNGGSKKNIGVCLKGMEFAFDDKSIYLVEWLELLKIFGVDKVIVYELYIHPNMKKVLQHYASEGFVDILPLSLPGDQPNTPHEMHNYIYKDMQLKRAHEKIPYHDCYYRNMNNYDYIVNLDMDEVIIPVKFRTWKWLFKHLERTHRYKNERPAAYSFRRYISLNKFREPHGYTTDIPEYMYILQNIYHSKIHEGGVKSALSSELVYTIENHHPRMCLGNRDKETDEDDRECFVPTVPIEEAYIIHYRGHCKDGRAGREKFCNANDTVQDTITWKYKDKLIKRTTDTLKLFNLV